MNYLIKPGGSLTGTMSVPGDKSISHRSVIFGSICDGVTEVSGLLEGMDVLATIHAFREMGIYIDGPDRGNLVIHGNGLLGLRAPRRPLDLGNSGTSMRLLTGLLSAQSFDTTLCGDESLNKRPMMRVVRPLTEMGARIVPTKAGTAPLTISGGCAISGGEFNLEVASAQVKSAILLAGLYASSNVSVTEPVATRDHTENILADMGCSIERKNATITLTPPESLQAKVIHVPADISSAAFFIVGASISCGSDLVIENVGMNPTRTGVLEILKLMNADISISNRRLAAGEPVADLRVRHSRLRGIHIPEKLVASAIDEFPCLMIAAACAEGRTTVTGARELRVKESDRIAATVDGLRAIGINCRELDDGMVVEGGVVKGGMVDSYDDHRIAMSFAIAGLASENDILVKDCRNVATSFPGFDELSVSAGLRLTSG